MPPLTQTSGGAPPTGGLVNTAKSMPRARTVWRSSGGVRAEGACGRRRNRRRTRTERWRRWTCVMVRHCNDIADRRRHVLRCRAVDRRYFPSVRIDSPLPSRPLRASLSCSPLPASLARAGTVRSRDDREDPRRRTESLARLGDARHARDGVRSAAHRVAGVHARRERGRAIDFAALGLQQPALETWPFGRGWELQKFTLRDDRAALLPDDRLSRRVVAVDEGRDRRHADAHRRHHRTIRSRRCAAGSRARS